MMRPHAEPRQRDPTRRFPRRGKETETAMATRVPYHFTNRFNEALGTELELEEARHG
jgi:hypothetical protein